MLFKKLLRTALKYKAQFISMIFMFTIGIGCYFGFNMEWHTLKVSRDETFETLGYSNYYLYYQEYNTNFFDSNTLDKIREIDNVNATGFLSIEVNKVKNDNEHDSKIKLSVIENYANPTKLYTVSGKDYNPSSNGIYLSDRYAKENNIKVGDNVVYKYLNYTMSLEVIDLVKSAEHLVCTSTDQLMPDYSTLGYGFVSPNVIKKLIGSVKYSQVNISTNLSKEKLEEEINNIVTNKINLISKEDSTAYLLVENEMKEGKTMASIIPLIFLFISILTLITTMNRIVKSEKNQIGILKSLGFRDIKILTHYTMYGIILSLIGLILGICLGYLIMNVLIHEGSAMWNYFDFINWKFKLPIFAYFVIFSIVILIILVTLLSVKSILKGSAADSLKPDTVKNIKPLKIEKTKFWNKLSFSTKWNLRDISRNKLRSIVALIGIIGSSLLIFACLGFNDTFNSFMNSLNDTYLYNTSVTLDKKETTSEVIDLANENNFDYSSTISIKIDKSTDVITYNIFNVSNNLYGFLDYQNKPMTLNNDGIYISRRIYDLGYRIGDTIIINPYGSNLNYEAKIVGYTLSSINQSIYSTFAYASTLKDDNKPLNYSIDTIYTNKTKIELENMNISYFSSITNKDDLLKTYTQMTDLMTVSITLLVLLSALLGLIVLYNLGIMNYFERFKELSTLKVVGFKDKKLSKILIEENMSLALIGIVLGIPLGYLIIKLLIKEFTSEYEFVLKIEPLSYLLTIIFVLLVSLLVSLMLSKKNKKIDMVSSLKGLD